MKRKLCFWEKFYLSVFLLVGSWLCMSLSILMTIFIFGPLDVSISFLYMIATIAPIIFLALFWLGNNDTKDIRNDKTKYFTQKNGCVNDI